MHYRTHPPVGPRTGATGDGHRSLALRWRGSSAQHVGGRANALARWSEGQALAGPVIRACVPCVCVYEAGTKTRCSHKPLLRKPRASATMQTSKIFRGLVSFRPLGPFPKAHRPSNGAGDHLDSEVERVANPIVRRPAQTPIENFPPEIFSRPHEGRTLAIARRVPSCRQPTTSSAIKSKASLV